MKSIQEIAQEIRNSSGECEFTALCLDYSKILKDALIENGYSAVVIQGTFSIDDPNASYYDDFGDEVTEEQMYTPLHYWVEVNGQIVDITADQFNDEIEEDFDKMPPIVIGSYEENPRYNPIRKDWK